MDIRWPKAKTGINATIEASSNVFRIMFMSFTWARRNLII
jgi:hypothetical protein